MSRLIQLRTNIVDAVKSTTGWTDVAGHYGRFTDQQLRDFLMAAPAARIAVLGLETPQEVPDDGVDYVARIGVYVATKDTNVVGNRDEIAIAAVEAIAGLCDRNRWELGSFCKAGHVAGAQNLYSEKGMSDGVALWAIDLRQPIRVSNVAAEIGAISQVFLGVAPNIGEGHLADYIEVSELPDAG